MPGAVAREVRFLAQSGIDASVAVSASAGGLCGSAQTYDAVGQHVSSVTWWLRSCAHCLFDQPVETEPAVVGVATIEPEGDVVEVVVEVLLAQCAVERSGNRRLSDEAIRWTPGSSSEGDAEVERLIGSWSYPYTARRRIPPGRWCEPAPVRETPFQRTYPIRQCTQAEATCTVGDSGQKMGLDPLGRWECDDEALTITCGVQVQRVWAA